jgi:hypothetical protein
MKKIVIIFVLVFATAALTLGQTVQVTGTPVFRNAAPQ